MSKWSHCDKCGETFDHGHGLSMCSALQLRDPPHADPGSLMACLGCLGAPNGHAEWCPERRAQQLVAALLAVEWTERLDCMECGRQARCPACDELGPGPIATLTRNATNTGWDHGSRPAAHAPGCPLDAALTAAGLDTQEKRDAAREKMR